MSDTKLPEAMIEAAARSYWGDAHYQWLVDDEKSDLASRMAARMLAAAGVPQMLACVEALREITQGGTNLYYREDRDRVREALAAFDKSFPQPPPEAA